MKKYLLIWIPLLAIILFSDFFPLPIKIGAYLNKVALLLLIITVSIFASNFLVKLLNFYVLQKTEVLDRVSILEILIKAIIYAVAFIVILSILGINIAPFLTTLGIAGLAVGLALKDTLENLFSGLYILMARQIRPGDFISLESGEEGFVEDINWRTTTIRLLSNNLLIIPNAKLAESRIVNYNLPTEELHIKIHVGVSYNSDLEKVEKVTTTFAREFIKSHPDCNPDFEPIVRFQGFGDYSINLMIILAVKEVGVRFKVMHDFVKKLHELYKKEGIEIPFPIRKIHLVQESEQAERL
ncbi:MAG: mechanosensitive ion channel family protein [Caldimicrobium sp.]